MTGTLSAPLARALIDCGLMRRYTDYANSLPTMRHGTPEQLALDWNAPILAALRSDPAVLAALAEALWKVLGWPSQPGNVPSRLLNWDFDNPAWNERAAAVLDALLGKP